MCNVVSILLSAVLLTLSSGINLEKALSDVDRAIAKRDEYDRAKEQRILEIKQNLRPDNEFSICNQLFQEYRYFQFDSAYVYARKMEALAKKTSAASETALSQAALLFCFKSVGYFSEATEIIRSFRPEGLSQKLLCSFYTLSAETYLNMSAYVGGTDDLSSMYDSEKLHYYELAKENAEEHTFEYDGIALELDICRNYTDSLAITGRKNFISQYQYQIGEHELGVQYSILAMAHDALKHVDEAVYYRSLSTACDIRSCTHETTSAKVLAGYMYARDEISRAHNYIKQALYDAQFYNSRLRRVELNSILSDIESRRYDWANRQRLMYLVFGSIVLLFLILTFILSVSLRKAYRKMAAAHAQLLVYSDRLGQSNKSLSCLNEKLKEVNDIKDSYIIQSLYVNPSFVNYIEKQSKVILYKIGTKQYDEAKTLLNRLDLKGERERIYSSFDTAFLKLFPNFIDEFNSLFPPSEGIRLDESGVLPVDVRVFALMRLGIDKPAQVAEYLNLSVNTVYVYKANLRAKSLYKDDFDERIMGIPKP